MIYQSKQHEKQLKVEQVINKKVLGTLFLLFLFIWVLIVIQNQNKMDTDIDENAIKLNACVVDAYSLSNSRTYVLEYNYQGIKYTSSSHRYGPKYQHKVGDTVCIEISTVNPDNIRFCEY